MYQGSAARTTHNRGSVVSIADEHICLASVEITLHLQELSLVGSYRHSLKSDAST